MYFYEVWVRSPRYHGSEALTYHAAERLPIGALVGAPLQKESVMGVVTAAVLKPSFKTKPLDQVYDLPPLPAHLLQLARWLHAYYPAPLGIIAGQILPAHVRAQTEEPPAEPDNSLPEVTLPPLTAEQAKALQQLIRPDTYLIHGKTGSGKTRLYLELTKRMLAEGKSAIILTPEISLTSQLARTFRATFGKRVVILHSQLTPKDRQNVWQAILAAREPLIVIGPRSALFSPLQKIGLIVLDESHEPAYKQEQAPHYQAGRVAARLAQLQGAYLLLGSATPSVSDYFLAEQRRKPILKLTELAQGKDSWAETELTIVDLKDHSLFPRTPHLSQPLTTAIEAALGKREQVLLYLNRRGTARAVHCEHCGWQALCPHCDLPLTYHGDSHQLRCHICNFHEPSPSACPVCGQPTIVFKSVGTKAIVEEVQRLFPNARVQRFDTDNKKAERFEQHYGAVHSGDVDILVGTQLLAKGLDLPRLSTLGVLIADTSLYLPDFSAQERTYQLLSQVFGRIGRGHVAGHAVIQTYQPNHPVIQAALTSNYQSFYDTELAERRKFNFPPFCYLLKLTVRRASIKAAEKAAMGFNDMLKAAKLRVEINGPAPAFHEKLQGKYQWQIVIKANERGELLKVIALMPANGWSYDIDPIDLL